VCGLGYGRAMQSGHKLASSVAEMVAPAVAAGGRARVLGLLAQSLADRIGSTIGVEDRYLAGVAKELRQTLEALATEGAQGDAFDELAKQLRAQMVNAEDT